MSHHFPLRLLPLLLVPAALLPAPSRAAEAAAPPVQSRPLAFVGGDTLTVADLDAALAETYAAGKGRAGAPTLEPEGVLKRLIENRLLEQEGYRMNADQDPMIKSQVRDFIRVLAVKALLDSVTAPPPGSKPASVDSLLGRTNTLRRYAHILVKTEDEARALRDSLSHGVPFAQLAKRHSTDDTAAQGGDLGWASPGVYVNEFETAARPLRPHEIAGPVRTKFGWHLITLLEERTDTLKSPVMAKGLLDSQVQKRRQQAVGQFVVELKRKYQITVNESLLRRLDYGSTDPAVEKALETSNSILAALPSGPMTVRTFTRNLRFQSYHGISGRADAANIRDRAFDDLLTESVLSYEARRRGFDRRPEVVEHGRREERRLIREKVLENILNIEFHPDSTEVRAYWQTHPTEFSTPDRVKLRGVLLTDQKAAEGFCRQLKEGAEFQWLRDRTPEVSDEPAPFPADWTDLASIGVTDKTLTVGSVIGPMGLEKGWAVAQVSAVDPPRTQPLDQCRDGVLKAMKGERIHHAVEDGLARLRAATRIRNANGAAALVKARIETWKANAPEGDQK